MKCEEAIRLIHLDAAGERSPEEEAALSEHLSGCPECSAEAELVQTTGHLLAALRTSTPELTGPDRLTRSILRRTTTEMPPGSETALRLVLDSALGAFVRPAFRYAYAALVLLIAGTLVFQQASTFKSLEKLSERLGHSYTPSRMDVQYSIPFQQAQKIAGTAALQPLLAATPAQISNDKISIRKSDLAPWLSSPPSRIIDNLIAPLRDPAEDLPTVFLNLQKSLSLSPILRVGGND